MARDLGDLKAASPRPAVLCLLVVIAFTLPLFTVAPAAASAPPQDPTTYPLPADVVTMAASHDGVHLAVMDETGRFTSVLDAGERERSWAAPAQGYLSLLHPELGEEEPRPVAVSMTPDGAYWAGATGYSGNFGGRVDGFAHWSDEPIWTYRLPDGDWTTPGVQPTALASGGGVHAVGTSAGKVHVLSAGGDEGTSKTPDRTYQRSNDGQPFGAITGLAVSASGDRFLIGTDTDGSPSLHLYTDIFWKATFPRVTEPVQHVAISSDGSRGAAATGTGDRARVHFLDTHAGATVWEHTVGSTVTSMALSSDGSLLAVGMTNGRVHLYEHAGGIMDNEPRRVFAFDSAVTSVAAAQGPRTAVAATENGRVHLLDLGRAKALWSYQVPAPAVAVAMSGDQGMITVASRSGDEGRVTYLPVLDDLTHLLPPAPRLLPGQSQSLPVELANNGNRMVTVEVAWRSLPSHWQGHDSNLSLAPGEAGTLGAKITLPPGQPQGDFDISFDLVTARQTVGVDVTVRVPEVTSGQSVKVWSFERAVPGGAPAAFLLHLLNTGNTANELAIGHSGLGAGWNAEFTGPQETKLRPGEDRQIALAVAAPPDAQVGSEVWFDLVVAWQHGEERHSMRVEIVDQDTYNFELNRAVGRGDMGDDEGIAPLLERLGEEAKRPIATTQEGGEREKSLPAGGLLIPLGAVAAAAAVTLGVVGRTRARRARRLRAARDDGPSRRR